MTKLKSMRYAGIAIIVITFLTQHATGRENSSLPPPSWQNPDIGLTLDGVIDAHDAENSWKSPGVTLWGAELIVSANIDPYASLLGNVLINEHGVELHEAFALFPFLPFNLKGKAGLMLANFGRWNRFHIHAMPFTSEPRIYNEYAGGMLALKGVEVSWMLPVPHYIEITASAYDLISGHSHDTDPPDRTSSLTPDNVAEIIGAEPHGSHWDYEGQHIYDVDDLYALAGLPSPDDPKIYRGLRKPGDFVYGGRVSTSFELGSQFSIDLGGSGLYQHLYKESKRVVGQTYSKLLYGTDMTLFWHPLASNKYRNLQAGAELLGSYEGFERLDGGTILEEYYNRFGIFSWIALRMSEQWQMGVFDESFRSNDYSDKIKQRYGGFVTLNISHYQYVRIELSRYDYPGTLEGVNRIILQYDATIGHHNCGGQR